jgi:hypothetical protein
MRLGYRSFGMKKSTTVFFRAMGLTVKPMKQEGVTSMTQCDAY